MSKKQPYLEGFKDSDINGGRIKINETFLSPVNYERN